MENAQYIGLSRQMVLRTGMDLIANNIANANTAGYRAQNPLFSEYISDPKGARDPISMAYDRGQYDVTRAGPIQTTGNDFDVALIGPGFIGVKMPDGSTQFTRSGNFQINASREVVTASGYNVSDSSGAVLVIPLGATDVSIDRLGRVSTQEGQVGQIMVREFDNPQTLEPQGSGLYKTEELGNPPKNTAVLQGQLEGSNVEPVMEMTRMIQISREYQSMQRFIQTDHDRQRTAIQRLGRPAGS
ncbi:MAG: flagellar basal-body rod protein FlgF [Alphaproteobacteria bacterium]|nr:flagellar basal-body rod protein FlgF [Alphaproteobacteria bacterium]